MRKIFKPTEIDYPACILALGIMNLIGKEVEIYPNYDTSVITYGRYKGQHRWMIKGHENLRWHPSEDFADVLELTSEEESKMDNLIEESLLIPLEV